MFIYIRSILVTINSNQSINNKDFDPSHLENNVLRKDVTKIFYTIMKEITGVSNHSLIRNSNAFMSKGGKIDPELLFSWIDDSYKEAQ